MTLTPPCVHSEHILCLPCTGVRDLRQSCEVEKMSSERLVRGQKLARESAMLAAPRRLHNTKLDDFDMVKTIGTGERMRCF